MAENLAASISNAEATVNSLPTKPLVTESSPQDEQPQAATDAAAVTVPALPPEDPLPNINGTTSLTAEAEQPVTTVADSQPSFSSDNPPAIPAVTSSVSEANLADSFVPSSIPTEIQSSATPIETSQSAMDVSQPTAAIAEPPISDLRTEPHSDALSTEAVAAIESHKHELDNSVDASGAPAQPVTLEKAPSTEGAQQGPGPATEPLTLADIGLPSPTQSPPPAPQPSHADLPAEKPVEPTVVESTLLPPSESIEVAPTAPSVPAPSVPESLPVPAAEPAPTTLPASLPAEEPVAPTPTPVPSRQIELEDQIMTDAAPEPVKQVREREDDDAEQERAAKRVKTDDELTSKTSESAFKVPEVPPTTSQSPPLANGNGTPTREAADADDSVTPARLAHMRKVISNLKKSNASAAFRQPVDYMALKIPNYPDIVKHPMDLSTIDHRLKQNTYTSIAAFVGDFEQIVDNCVLFNGQDHGVTQQARKMQSSFRSQMKNLPKATVEEPTKETKKAAKKQEPTRQAPPRRPSVSTAHPGVTKAPSPKTAAPPTPSFAPGPDGVPLIRRDSSLLIDGRPKRAIVPTKRNQDLGAGRPKKKKYELQLKFCDEVLREISSPKYWQMNQYFLYPVDPVALNIPTYFQMIKKPMDLGTIKTNLSNNVYEKAKDFEEDVRLVFKNCFRFNPEGDLVNASGHQLEELFNKKWATKDDWLAAREPPSEPHTDENEDEDDEEDSEDEADNESEDDRNDKIKLLQQQIELMSKQMGELTQKKPKKSKSPQAKKNKTKSGKKDKKPVAAPNSGKDKKDKKKAPKKEQKDRYVTFAEKQYISNGIAMLPEKQMQEALKIIQNSVPSLANSDQNEIELDIEEVPNHALLKLLNFVKKYAGPPPDEPKVERTEVYNAPAATKHKKAKPMNKYEQEAQIEELKGKLGAYAGGTMSPNAMQSIEDGDSSDDDGDSEESEEE